MSDLKIIVRNDGSIVWDSSIKRYMSNDGNYGLHYIDNYEFEDILKYNGYYENQTTCNLCFISMNNKKEYIMYLPEFDECVNKLTNGKLIGKFTFCKHGKKYGIKYLG